MRRSPRPVPALLSFPDSSAKRDGWGKLTSLTPHGAVLSTQFTLEEGERLFLSLRLGHEQHERVAALAVRVAPEGDGYATVELAFTDEVQKRGLAKTLLSVLAT